MRSVIRLTQLLQCVASSHLEGMSLAELAQRTDMSKATVLRFTRALRDGGWLVKDERTGRLTLGAEAWLLGRQPQPALDAMLRSAQIQLRRLARETGDTVYLALRSGVDMVFLHRVPGMAPIRATVSVGHRQCIGIGAAGLALMAGLAPAECDALVKRLAPRLASLRLSSDVLLAEIERSRDQGFAHSRGTVFFKVPAIGLVIRDAALRPIAAVSLGANADRLTRAHIQNCVPRLRKAVFGIEQALVRHASLPRLSKKEDP